jgi:hypothetical protein
MQCTTPDNVDAAHCRKITYYGHVAWDLFLAFAVVQAVVVSIAMFAWVCDVHSGALLHLFKAQGHPKVNSIIDIVTDTDRFPRSFWSSGRLCVCPLTLEILAVSTISPYQSLFVFA